MIGGVGIQEILIILVVGLVVFGAARLPKIARSLGLGIKEFKKTIKSIENDNEEDNRNKIKYTNTPPHHQQQQQYNQGQQNPNYNDKPYNQGQQNPNMEQPHNNPNSQNYKDKPNNYDASEEHNTNTGSS